MKREILFRGKRVDNGEWVYGYYVYRPDGKHLIYWKPFDEASQNTYHIVIPETVGQLIGEIKSGGRIFYGDIIQHGESIRFLEYRNGNTCATRMDKSSTILLSFCEHPKLIGNIHDNSELTGQEVSNG